MHAKESGDALPSSLHSKKMTTYGAVMESASSCLSHWPQQASVSSLDVPSSMRNVWLWAPDPI